jgi:mRNA interferase MazF
MIQGDIWIAEFPGKVRPVLVVTRTSALNVLKYVTVAPVTSTIRDLPTHLKLGPAEGLHHDCAANFDDLHTLPKAFLTRRIGQLGQRSIEMCAALSATADC